MIQLRRVLDRYSPGPGFFERSFGEGALGRFEGDGLILILNRRLDRFHSELIETLRGWIRDLILLVDILNIPVWIHTLIR